MDGPWYRPPARGRPPDGGAWNATRSRVLAASPSRSTASPSLLPVRRAVAAALIAAGAALAVAPSAMGTGAIDAQRAQIRELEAQLSEVQARAGAAASALLLGTGTAAHAADVAPCQTSPGCDMTQ